MPHYHLHAEKRLENGSAVNLNYIVNEADAKREQQLCVEMGYTVKHNRCTEASCLGSSLQTR